MIGFMIAKAAFMALFWLVVGLFFLAFCVAWVAWQLVLLGYHRLLAGKPYKVDWTPPHP